MRVGRWGVASAHSGRRWRGRRDSSRVCGYGMLRGTERVVAPFFSFPFFSFPFICSQFANADNSSPFSPLLGGVFFPPLVLVLGSKKKNEQTNKQTTARQSWRAGGHASGRACAASSSSSPSFPSPPLSSCFRAATDMLDPCRCLCLF